MEAKLRVSLLRADSTARTITELIGAAQQQPDLSENLRYWILKASDILCADGVKRLETERDNILFAYWFQDFDEEPVSDDD